MIDNFVNKEFDKYKETNILPKDLKEKMLNKNDGAYKKWLAKHEAEKQYEESIINVEIINNSIPAVKHSKGDAGYDMYCTKDTWIFPFKVTKVPLNMKFELKDNTYGLVTSRSGESAKGNIVIPGILDSSYRGQVWAIMTRIGLLPRKIKKGTRIAQIIIMDHHNFNLYKTNTLSETVRGDKGFGSSGIE